MRRHPSHTNTGYTNELELSGSGAEKSIMAAKFVQRLYWNGSQWMVFDHTSITSPSHTAVTGGIYVPPFLVRVIKIEGTNLQLAYDMPGSQMGSNTNPICYNVSQYNNRSFYPMQVTALYLDPDRALTTCDAVELYG